MKKGVIIIGLLIGIFLINLINANFILAPGNKSFEINTDYASSESIKGWMNISFQNEPAESLLTGFDSSIKLIDFLDENSAYYSCFPSNCEKGYSTTNPGTSKNFSIGYLKQRLIGINLTQNINSITNISFDVSTIDDKSCQNPLKIDLLDDGLIEWKANSVSDIFACIILNPYGCYNSADASDSVEITQDSLYCEKIDIPTNRGLRIGADITGNGSAVFEMSVNAESYSESCDINIAAGGKIKCNLTFEDDLTEPTQAIVCITKKSGATYNIKYEDVEPCGYSGEYQHDFPIFAEVAKYNSVNDFTFSQALIDTGNTGIDLSSEIWDYLISNYGGNCNPQCIIPIRIYSGASQELTISNLNLKYKSNDLPKTESKIYDVNDSIVLINLNYSKLDLGKANFLTPSSYGNKTFILRLNNQTILEKKINVKAVPKITGITPLNVPALVSYPFIVFLEEESGNLTYTWDFGDNSSKQTTNTKMLEHIYQKLGDYSLTVTVSNKLGNSSKTVSVRVDSPRGYINDTINDYNKKLNSIETQINKLPDWIQNEIKKEFDTAGIKYEISTQAKKFDPVFSSDAECVKIMEVLVALDIPNSFNISQSLAPSNVFPNPEQINLAALDYLGAGSIDGTEEDYVNAVNYWIINALQMTIESKTYSLYYENEVKDLFSYVRVTLTPKENQKLATVYFLVNGNPDEIKFNTDKTAKEYDDASGIIFSDLETQESIEFLYPEKINIGSLPIYVAPEFKDLSVGINPEICNFNKRCEKDLGEDYKNCRPDCKPVGLTILWICILLFIAICIYVALQEWYKRHYERHLFHDKNQLFNLINFMNNSSNQGMKKQEILDKLKDLGWNNEQLKYAWNKFQGKRTGMWEIPVFKWVEKRQVKKELEKRGSLKGPPVGI